MMWMEMYNPDLICSMYDVDGNGWIDLEEMTQLVESIYKFMGTRRAQCESARERAIGIFERMNFSSDGKVTKEEFTQTCLEDQRLIDLPTFSVSLISCPAYNLLHPCLTK